MLPARLRDSRWRSISGLWLERSIRWNRTLLSIHLTAAIRTPAAVLPEEVSPELPTDEFAATASTTFSPAAFLSAGYTSRTADLLSRLGLD
jgi:hypothetical protein